MIRPIPQRPIGSKLQKRLLCTLSAAGLLALMLPERAAAAELYDADGLDIRWDNTLRYSAGIRLAAESPILLGFANSNDGDSDFAPGLVSNRLDVVSVLDITGDSFGVQASFDGWYDTVYHTRTDNKSPASYNLPGR